MVSCASWARSRGSERVGYVPKVTQLSSRRALRLSEGSVVLPSPILSGSGSLCSLTPTQRPPPSPHWGKKTLQPAGSCKSHFIHSPRGGGGGPGQQTRPLGRRRWGASVGGVEGAPLVPLHVADAAHRLHLGVGGPKVTAVLVVPLLQQVLQPTVARVLVAHPPAGPEVGEGKQMKVRGTEYI